MRAVGIAAFLLGVLLPAYAGVGFPLVPMGSLTLGYANKTETLSTNQTSELAQASARFLAQCSKPPILMFTVLVEAVMLDEASPSQRLGTARTTQIKRSLIQAGIPLGIIIEHVQTVAELANRRVTGQPEPQPHTVKVAFFCTEDRRHNEPGKDK